MGTKNRFMVLLLFLVLMAVFGFGGTAEAAFQALSPNRSLTNGLPVWYQDTTGLKLGLCQTPDPLCLAVPIDATNPASVAMGLGDETFYWVANAKIDMPTIVVPLAPGLTTTGGKAQLIMALEAAFAGVPMRDGGQMVFARHRIIIDAPVAGVYTVTHPYGVEQFNVTQPGVHAIVASGRAAHIAGNLNLLGDIGCGGVPCDFSLALGGLIGPFLKWDPAVPPAAPVGYLGDPAVEHQVTGSPTGQNIFRVDGPIGSNLGGPGVNFVETNLFVVQGKILPPQPPVATFSRDALGVGAVNVSATDAPAALTVDVAGELTALPLEPVALAPVVGQPGSFSVAIPIGALDALPANVVVTFDRGLPSQTIQTVPLTDVVTITTATFDPVAGNTVTVTATSSNLFDNTLGGAPLPVLTVRDPAIPAPGDVIGIIGLANTLTVPGVATTPGRAVVTSSNGGIAMVSVVNLRPSTLAAVSATRDPLNGFPDWYQDSTGMRLGLCMDPVLCLPAGVDPLNPASVALGVGDETFYWMADANVDLATGGKGLLILAQEATFVQGAPVIGEQIVFARARMRIDAPVRGVYTVIHPYGVEQFDVITPGPRSINSEAGAPHIAGNIGRIGDVGCFTAPCDFSQSLFGLIGPFLTWDPLVPPAAPVGYIGDPAIRHAVTGSPIGQNIFRVVGPLGSNIGGPGVDFVETNLFTVQGRIFGQGAPSAPGATFTANPIGVGTITTVTPAPPATIAVDVVGVTTPLPGQPLDGTGIPLAPLPGQPNVFQGNIALGPNDPLPTQVTITIDRGLPTQATQTVALRDVVSVVTATFEPAKGRLKVKAASSNQNVAAPAGGGGGGRRGRRAPVLTVANPALAPLVENLRDGSIELASAGDLGTIDTSTTDTLDVSGITTPPTSLVVTSADGGTTTVPVTNVTDPNDPGAPVIPGNLPTLADLAGSSSGGCFIDGLIE